MSALRHKGRSIVRISNTKLAEMIKHAIVDAYDEPEQVTGWFTMIEENLAVPFKTTVVGVQVIVQRIDLDRSDQIIAVCRHGRTRRSLSILDLPLPTPPPDGAEWIEAYRRWRAQSSVGRNGVRYWWVNQNQTFRQEIERGYLWSPKRNQNGHRNPFYEFMREVAPGDVVFSFCDTRIAALGIASGHCRESPKPEEFGTAGTNWSQIGWRVGVRWQRLTNAIRPKDHIARLRPDLAGKYAPLTPEGNGLQSVYLTQLSAGLASALFSLIGKEASSVADVGQEIGKIERDSPAPERDIEEWERRVEVAIAADSAIRETERTALVQARRGQGLFRDNVQKLVA
jgi:hypothetical protein